MIQPLLDTPVSELAAWVLNYVRRENLLAPGDRVLVGVSGGPDSVALLHLLVHWRTPLDLSLGVGHFEHGLRGRQSQDDAAFVADLARGLGLPFHPGRGDVRESARRARISLQMAGRKLRLDFLREICRQQGYNRLALGHTADDQVELFFLRLFRGAGLEGLKGMLPATSDGLVRPLLAVGKAVLLAYLEAQHLPYRRDASNLSRNYLRNRIRLDLLPELSRRYNPRLAQTIWRTQALLREEERLLAGEVEQAWSTVGKAVAEGFISLNLARLLSLDPALQRRVVRAAAAKLGTAVTLTAPQVASLLDLARGAKSGGRISLGRELLVARAGPELHLLRRLPDLPEGTTTLLPEDAREVDSPEGWRWHLSLRPHAPEAPGRPLPDAATIDPDLVSFPLKVRYLQPGDRFWPQGAPGPKKLQDFLVDRKIPRWLRPYLPLVESAGRIIWVPGLQVAEWVKLTPASRRRLEIKIAPTSSGTQRIWEFLLAHRQAKSA